MAKAPVSRTSLVIPDDDTEAVGVASQNAAIPGTTDAEAIRASEFLGSNEDGAPSVGKDEEIRRLQAQIASLQGPTDLKLEVGSTRPYAEVAAAAAGVKPIGMPKTVRIILEEVENMPPTGQTFSLNGKAYLIRPGEPVDVPLGILEVIDNAVGAKPIHDPQTMRVVGYRNAHRFPYRLVRGAAA